MYKFLSAVLALSLLACGGSDSQVTQTPKPPTDVRLKEQLHRMLPLLTFCGNVVAEDSPNNLTGQPHCGTGDSMIGTGVYITAPLPGREQLFAGILDSIAPNGRPYRSPQYRAVGHSEDSFSRDQTIGLLLYLMESKDTITATKVWNYVKGNNLNICPDDSDGRCKMTPNMLALWSDVFTYLEIPKDPLMTFSRNIDEDLLIIQARSAPAGYPLHLISQNIWLRIKLGRLSVKYAEVAAILAARQPYNLWFAYLEQITQANKEANVEKIGAELATCMEQWPGENKYWWTFSKERNEYCEGNSQGHDLVWLSALLLERL